MKRSGFWSNILASILGLYGRWRLSLTQYVKGVANPDLSVISETLADRYRAGVGSRTHWLTYHLHKGRVTEFGEALIQALASCEYRLPGLGERLVDDLIDTGYTPAAQDPAAWRAGFQQLLQKFAEILVLRVLVEAPWPAGANFRHEPANPNTGRRPELAVELEERVYLFEVKCPSLVDHQAARGANARQIPARSALGDALRAKPDPNDPVTWPRDNVLKDFLESADGKFSGFSAKETIGVLVVFWDAYVYEPISALIYPRSGLLTEQSFYQVNGVRVPFDAVDGVIVMNHLAVLHAGAQEQGHAHRPGYFRLDHVDGGLPNVWCQNIGGKRLDAFLMQALDAIPVEDAEPAEYRPHEFIMWINLPD
ncbi:conserved hypothetical protein [Mesorhizobium prunaredense]|uniref:Uncharacterized protein n=1 Tax=Mesorhizobium prunaredense TaxID=1631249 RepID=A0A1R3VBG9_9HYPH|nr:conserved hypothetical protein [Mesorhizobium prunaredense]